MKPLNLAEALAVPLYKAFTPTAENSAPYDAITPSVSMTARNANTAANRRVSAGLNLSQIDLVPQRKLDEILWKSVHGINSQPPPPGPNAVQEGGSGEPGE
jgi:hypothetical protein